MMINRQRVRTFLDTNILIFADNYQKDNVFDWIDELYSNVWVHVDVLDEMLLGRKRIDKEIDCRSWNTFDPIDLSDSERVLYEAHLAGIKLAFQNMRKAQGNYAKTTPDTGEKATLAVCILQDAQLICSNDIDISEVVERENYCYVDDDGNSKPILQDTVSDFCYHCVVDIGIPKAKVRRFYKSIFENKNEREVKLAIWDHRFSDLK